MPLFSSLEVFDADRRPRTHHHRTKKFLKKQQLRDWLRVVSTSRGVYELKFFNVVNDEADEDDE